MTPIARLLPALLSIGTVGVAAQEVASPTPPPDVPAMIAPVPVAPSAAAAPSSDRVPAPLAQPPVYRPPVPYGDADGTVEAPADRVATLADALALAYAGNPTLLAERANVRSADYSYPQARSAFGPRFDLQLGADAQRTRVELPQFATPPARGLSGTANAILRQPIYTGGRAEAAVQQSLARVAVARDTLRLREAQTLLAATTAFIGVARDRAGVRIAEANLALLDRQFADNSARFTKREITVSDLNQVQTRRDLGRAQLLDARGRLGVSTSEFLQSVGRLPADRLEPPGALTVPFLNLEDALLYAQAASPLARAAQSREKVSRAAVERARAETLPSVAAVLSAGYGTANPYRLNGGTTDFRAGASVDVPLIDTGGRRAAIREAEEANDADRRLVDAALRDTQQAVTGAWNTLAAARASLTDYRSAVDAAQAAYEGARLQQRAGDRTTLDVLDLARDLLNLRTDYAVVLANEYLARANLLATAGLLEARRLVPGLQPYDPAEHFRAVAGNGDAPVLTDALASLDRLTVQQVSGDVPVRDPAALLFSGTLVELEATPPPADFDPDLGPADPQPPTRG